MQKSVKYHITGDIISLKEIIKIFFLVHDPTTLNGKAMMLENIIDQSFYLTMNQKRKL